MKSAYEFFRYMLYWSSSSLLTWSSIVNAAPITFNTALPVAEGEFLIREQLIVNQSGDDPSGANRNRTETSAVTALGYGINPKWTVFAVLPYRDINLDLNVGAQRLNRRNRGIGNLTVFSRYIAYKKDQLGQTFRIAPFFGLTAPTGEDNVKDSLGTLPPSVQVASGSLDVFTGVVFTWQTLKYQTDIQLSYRANNEENGFQFGNVARFDGSYQHWLWRSENRGGIPDYLYGVLEANLVNQEKNRISGNEDHNSNGTRLFLSPGI